jgi:hypothetical protein
MCPSFRPHTGATPRAFRWRRWLVSSSRPRRRRAPGRGAAVGRVDRARGARALPDDRGHVARRRRRQQGRRCTATRATGSRTRPTTRAGAPCPRALLPLVPGHVPPRPVGPAAGPPAVPGGPVGRLRRGAGRRVRPEEVVPAERRSAARARPSGLRQAASGSVAPWCTWRTHASCRTSTTDKGARACSCESGIKASSTCSRGRRAA